MSAVPAPTHSLRLVDPEAGLAEKLHGPLAAAGFALAGSDASVDVIRDPATRRPDVFVVDAGACGDKLVDSVRAIVRRWPDSCVVVTADGTSATTISRAVSAGARGFLLKPYTPEDLASTVREAFQTTCATGQVAEAASGAIVAVYSPKGGTGCSTIASNVAATLAADHEVRVALVDLDLQFGDLATMLDVKAANSIIDLLDHDPLDSGLIAETFVRHPSGVHVLAAPFDLAVAGSIDMAKMERTLLGVSRHFDIVICDLWSNLDELTARVLRIADCVVLVTKPELPALKNMSRVLGAVDLRLLLDDTSLMVANRLPAKGGLSTGDVERALARSITVSIPSDGAAVTDAINRGITVIDPRIHSRAAPSYRELARAVLGQLGRTPERTAVSAPA